MLQTVIQGAIDLTQDMDNALGMYEGQEQEDKIESAMGRFVEIESALSEFAEVNGVQQEQEKKEESRKAAEV